MVEKYYRSKAINPDQQAPVSLHSPKRLSPQNSVERFSQNHDSPKKASHGKDFFQCKQFRLSSQGENQQEEPQGWENTVSMENLLKNEFNNFKEHVRDKQHGQFASFEGQPKRSGQRKLSSQNILPQLVTEIRTGPQQNLGPGALQTLQLLQSPLSPGQAGQSSNKSKILSRQNQITFVSNSFRQSLASIQAERDQYQQTLEDLDKMKVRSPRLMPPANGKVSNQSQQSMQKAALKNSQRYLLLNGGALYTPRMPQSTPYLQEDELLSPTISNRVQSAAVEKEESPERRTREKLQSLRVKLCSDNIVQSPHKYQEEQQYSPLVSARAATHRNVNGTLREVTEESRGDSMLLQRCPPQPQRSPVNSNQKHHRLPVLNSRVVKGRPLRHQPAQKSQQPISHINIVMGANTSYKSPSPKPQPNSTPQPRPAIKQKGDQTITHQKVEMDLQQFRQMRLEEAREIRKSQIGQLREKVQEMQQIRIDYGLGPSSLDGSSSVPLSHSEHKSSVTVDIDPTQPVESTLSPSVTVLLSQVQTTQPSNLRQSLSPQQQQPPREQPPQSPRLTPKCYQNLSTRISLKQQGSTLPLLVIPSHLFSRFKKQKLQLKSKTTEILTELQSKYQLVITCERFKHEFMARLISKSLPQTVSAVYLLSQLFSDNVNLDQIKKDFKTTDCTYVSTYTTNEDLKNNPVKVALQCKHLLLPCDNTNLQALVDLQAVEITQEKAHDFTQVLQTQLLAKKLVDIQVKQKSVRAPTLAFKDNQLIKTKLTSYQQLYYAQLKQMTETTPELTIEKDLKEKLSQLKLESETLFNFTYLEPATGNSQQQWQTCCKMEKKEYSEVAKYQLSSRQIVKQMSAKRQGKKVES